MLRHSHICGRSFDPNVRARELQVAADAAVKARVSRMEQLPAHGVERPAHQLERGAERQPDPPMDRVVMENKYEHLLRC